MKSHLFAVECMSLTPKKKSDSNKRKSVINFMFESLCELSNRLLQKIWWGKFAA